MTRPKKTPWVDGASLPPAGPLTRWPDVTTSQAHRMLEQALAGLTLGPVDQDAQARLTELDPAIAAAVVASWLRRAWTAGVAAGRAEVVDEAPAVARARAKAQARTRQLAAARATVAQVTRWWRDATAERDEARDDLRAAARAEERCGQVVDEVV